MENAVFPGSSDQVDPNSFYYRHFLSNNGLYDVFSFWNRYKRPVTADLVLPAVGSAPTSAIKVKTGETVALTKNAEGLPVLKMQIEANESQSFLTPRADLATASRDWFALQREWWKGTTPPPARPLPSYAQIHRFTLPLDEDWAFKTLTDQENGETLAAPGVDDSAWEKRAISGQLIPMPDPRKPQTLLFRKHFTVPPAWNKGSVTLFMTPTEGDAFSDPAKIYCDGVPLKDPVRAVIDESFGGAFKAGTGHVLAVEMPKTSSIIGCTGSSWLYYRPDATEGIDLAGGLGIFGGRPALRREDRGARKRQHSVRAEKRHHPRFAREANRDVACRCGRRRFRRGGQRTALQPSPTCRTARSST